MVDQAFSSPVLHELIHMFGTMLCRSWQLLKLASRLSWRRLMLASRLNWSLLIRQRLGSKRSCREATLRPVKPRLQISRCSTPNYPALHSHSKCNQSLPSARFLACCLLLDMNKINETIVGMQASLREQMLLQQGKSAEASQAKEDRIAKLQVERICRPYIQGTVTPPCTYTSM